MSANGFDVLPLVAADGSVSAYYRTHRWNTFDDISLARITYADVISFDTPIREVIRSLAERDRQYYFLTYESEVSGLISIANLNARQVQVYLFGLLSEFEKRLGTFIAARIQPHEVAATMKPASTIARRYKQDQRNGVESHPVEYLGFGDLIELASRHGLLDILDSTTDTDLDLRELRHLRNKIAHPIKSVVGKSTSVRGLWQWIQLVEELIFGLRVLQPGAD
jgi:hypothetical protein